MGISLRVEASRISRTSLTILEGLCSLLMMNLTAPRERAFSASTVPDKLVRTTTGMLAVSGFSLILVRTSMPFI